MAVLASKGTASVTLAIGETLNVLAGGQGVAVLKGGASKGQSVELGASVRKIGPFPFAMPITINSQNGAITYYVGADSAAPHVDIAGEYDAETGQTVLDDASKNALSNSGVGGKIYAALAASRANAPYRGPISLASGVTVTAGVVAPAVTEYRYWTGNNARYFKIFGLGASAFFEQYATTYLRAKGPRTADATWQNGVGGWAAQIRFTGQTVTFSVVGSTVNYIVLVNGKPTNTAGYNQAAAGRIEVNCGSSGDWEITLVMRQDHALMGVFSDGQLHAQPDVTGSRILYIGDSFCASVTSPASTISDQGYAPQLRLQHGFGVETIVQGIGSSGYQTGNLLTNAWRYGDAALVNPDLIVLPFGTNDVGGGATEATVKAGVSAGIAALVAACPTAKILVVGPWPKNLNLSTTLLDTELWISQACASANVAFYPISTVGASLPGGGTLSTPWVWGDGDTDTAETVAGNSKWVTGNDGTHPSPSFGAAYLAARTVDAVVETCKKLGW